jgi:hypothetical protein
VAGVADEMLVEFSSVTEVGWAWGKECSIFIVDSPCAESDSGCVVSSALGASGIVVM